MFSQYNFHTYLQIKVTIHKYNRCNLKTAISYGKTGLLLLKMCSYQRAITVIWGKFKLWAQ
ncbi:MAG TPA: hypothetical protein DGG95_17560 [Cytophagales bacterium]|nr:hypothetical protein [Cytophagales bacterium]